MVDIIGKLLFALDYLISYINTWFLKSDCKLKKTSPNANNMEDAERLWNLSVTMTKL